MSAGGATRVWVAGLSLSAAAFVGLLTHEGYRERAYADPAHGSQVPTVGFGSTGADITMATQLAPLPAVQRALRDAGQFEGAIKRCVRVPLSQAEYDVFVALTYNVGHSAFCRSTLVRRLNAGDYRGACEQILRWRFANGQDCSAPGNRSCRGLWQRRLDAHERCLTAVAAAEGE